VRRAGASPKGPPRTARQRSRIYRIDPSPPRWGGGGGGGVGGGGGGGGGEWGGGGWVPLPLSPTTTFILSPASTLSWSLQLAKPFPGKELVGLVVGQLGLSLEPLSSLEPFYYCLPLSSGCPSRAIPTAARLIDAASGGRPAREYGRSSARKAIGPVVVEAVVSRPPQKSSLYS